MQGLWARFVRASVCCFLFSSLIHASAVLLTAQVPEGQDAQAASVDPVQQDVLAGHSYHGEVFNEGPRQKAYVMGGTGTVHFPITTKNPEVQKFFDQGIGQLHGFWYLEAERSFRYAASMDRDCAMTYWGAAMANLRNDKRAKGFIEEAVERKDNAGEREVMYINALEDYITADQEKKDERNDDYTKALENIILKYPDDLEAKASLVLHLYFTRSSSTSYFAVDALIQQILAVEPMHPIHHYRIHLWDHRKPEEALSSAARCGQSSPSIAHMWHMPGHIYSRLKRYNDASWQQEASARVDHAHMLRDRVMPDEIHNYAHNNEWLIRNLIHVGRVHEAIHLAKNMIELPRHPRYNMLSKRGSAYYGRLRLLQVLRTYELWDDMIGLADTPYWGPSDVEDEQIARSRHLGLAYFQNHDMTKGAVQIVELQERLDSAQADKQEPDEDVKEDSGTPEKEEEKADQAAADAAKKLDARIRKLEQALNALQGHQAVAKGDYQTGYDMLKKCDDVDKLHLARVQWLAGQREQAEKAMRNHVESHKNEVRPLAILIETLWRAGKKGEAKEFFTQLRDLSGPIDLDIPVFARLAPLAEELSLPADWRVTTPLPKDLGTRPDLDSLGTFRWHPSPAPEWSLKDSERNIRTSREFRGRPYVIIFYLGYGCLHCAEQLKAFAPMVGEFENAGLAMIAISTDDQQGLKASIDGYGESKMPIPLVANTELDVFKAYRVHDDFEDLPLHGTFVIDPEGFVRWQDISYEPFMDPNFVLEEAKRLLAQDSIEAPRARIATGNTRD